MLQNMDLQTQYDKTLQNTIGQSQRQRNEAIRQSQGGVTDWEQRGASGFRGAGFNEVNPSTMPAMDETTRGFLAPVLGTYQEGGQNKEGFYGDTNPYSLEGALKYAGKAGYTGADSTLQQQAKETGQALPSLFGHTLANDAARTWGKDYGNWKTQQAEAQRQYEEQQRQYEAQLAQQQQSSGGFTPGQDNGDWKWQAGVPTWAKMLGGGWQDELIRGFDVNNTGVTGGSPEEQWGKDADAAFGLMYPEGSGSWQYMQNGKAIDVPVMEYTPKGGVQMQKQDKLAGNPGSWMPQLTQAVMSMINPAAGAMMSTAKTGLNTGDWKQAIGQGALSYAGSKLGDIYGGDLGSKIGFTGDLAKNIGSGLIGAGTNIAGNAMLGNGVNWGSALGAAAGNIGGNYLGGLANSAVGGGMLGDIASGAVKGLTKGVAGGLASGKGLDLSDVATRTALGAAAPTLGNLFSDTSASPQERGQNTRVASSGLNLANTLYKNNKRK